MIIKSQQGARIVSVSGSCALTLGKGFSMHTIMVPLHAVDLAQVMTMMRRWLDEHQVQPSLFRYDNVGEGELTVKLDFAACGDADVFAAAFCARQEPGEERRGALW